MTARVEHLISCDGEERGEPCQTEWGGPIPGMTRAELRRHLKSVGWSRASDGRDLCPECTAAPDA
ncbi:hypothetical protein ACIA6C_27910 [Streptomyces sp. NPDC051578]|uniref:hypothetical protein n=1 Tax=Streptomyces sp. NPDC051578 TaxID=3365662 RepID=UPI0037B262F7